MIKYEAWSLIYTNKREEHGGNTNDCMGVCRERANVVYQVPCANCPATYVGQSGRQLHQRLKEYRRAVESGNCANSALAEHAWGCHHPVDWDRVRVLDCHPHLHQRLTLESVHIRSQSKPVNRDLGTMPQIYSPLFN